MAFKINKYAKSGMYLQLYELWRELIAKINEAGAYLKSGSLEYYNLYYGCLDQLYLSILPIMLDTNDKTRKDVKKIEFLFNEAVRIKAEGDGFSSDSEEELCLKQECLLKCVQILRRINKGIFINMQRCNVYIGMEYMQCNKDRERKEYIA